MMISRFTEPNRWAMASFKGRPFFLLTVKQGDTPLPGWVPADGVAVHQGWSSDGPPLHEQVHYQFSLGIPETWASSPQWVCIPPNLHSVGPLY